MSETRNGVMSRCEPCGGNGYHSGYGGKDRCEDCLGTGRELTLREREMVEALLQAIDVRERIGRG
mgnify:CR=1 FL=1